MNPDLDTLATRLYVTIDDLLIDHPRVGSAAANRWDRPEAHRCRVAHPRRVAGTTRLHVRSPVHPSRHAHLRPWFPYLPDRPGYNKRLRRAGHVMQHVIAALARACPSWNDDLWMVDSTPVECGRSRETVKRSDLAGWATYGYCASHSRFFWGLRLHLIVTPSGLPVAYALAGAKTDERDTALDMICLNPELLRPGQVLMADKGYRRADFEAELTTAGITLIRPTFGKDKPRPHQRFLRPFRQIIESVNQTLKAQLDLERHGGRTKPGVCARVLQRLLALTAAIWHNETSSRPGPARSLLAYDH